MSRVNIWFKTYPADFAADTQHLTNEEVGAYQKLLCAIWRKDGSIRADPEYLARLLGVSAQKWKSLSESVLPLFVEKAGTLTHDHLSDQLVEAKNRSEQSRQAANKRWSGGMRPHSERNATAMQTQCKSESESESEILSVKGGGVAFNPATGEILGGGRS